MQGLRLLEVTRQLLTEVPDADLLARYVRHRADDAFAQLVARYNRLVWGQCRNLLPGDADADDAFQATFLVLARSAGTLPAGTPLGPWLHGVAYRVCQNARRAAARRTRRERASARPEAGRPVADSAWEAAFAAVAEEVQKLPAGQRTAFVLCCVEGRSHADAAAALGVGLGALTARLSRAKQALLDRLARRGLGVGVLALGAVTGGAAMAPAGLVGRTLSLVPPGAIVPGSVRGLLHGVSGMTMIPLKMLAAGVLVATGLGLGAEGWYAAATGQPPGPPPSKTAPPVAADDPKPPVVLEAEVRTVGAQGFRSVAVSIQLVGVKETAVITDGLTVTVTRARDGKKVTLTATLPETRDGKGRLVVPSADKLAIVQLQAGEVAHVHVAGNGLAIDEMGKDAVAGKLELVVEYEVPEVWAKRFKVAGGKVTGVATVGK